ncbi:MAG: HPr family phosphocarrier protein [Hyphomicrobiales bacterium]|nr:HPr family phosphocarrier protein [OCS116 cluster bacterium]PCI86162.1 MAG: HPr family phosphocarrier protein [Hyphomicrobiales bacterium]
MSELELQICNQRGLHARASAKFVKCAAQFKAKITVSKDGTSVDATSIMGLMMLGASIGCRIALSAEGKDADDALNAISDLVARRFDEEC